MAVRWIVSCLAAPAIIFASSCLPAQHADLTVAWPAGSDLVYSFRDTVEVLEASFTWNDPSINQAPFSPIPNGWFSADVRIVVGEDSKVRVSITNPHAVSSGAVVPSLAATLNGSIDRAGKVSGRQTYLTVPVAESLQELLPFPVSPSRPVLAGERWIVEYEAPGGPFPRVQPHQDEARFVGHEEVDGQALAVVESTFEAPVEHAWLGTLPSSGRVGMQLSPDMGLHLSGVSRWSVTTWIDQDQRRVYRQLAQRTDDVAIVAEGHGQGRLLLRETYQRELRAWVG